MRAVYIALLITGVALIVDRGLLFPIPNLLGIGIVVIILGRNKLKTELRGGKNDK